MVLVGERTSAIKKSKRQWSERRRQRLTSQAIRPTRLIITSGNLHRWRTDFLYKICRFLPESRTLSTTRRLKMFLLTGKSGQLNFRDKFYYFNPCFPNFVPSRANFVLARAAEGLSCAAIDLSCPQFKPSRPHSKLSRAREKPSCWNSKPSSADEKPSSAHFKPSCTHAKP